jgi:hypothetical protein
MNAETYYLIHVVSLVLLAAFTFQVFAKRENKKGMMMLTGILSLLALVGGFGLLAQLKHGFPVWVIIKLVCWLGLSAMAGLAFRKPGSIGTLKLLSIVLIAIAVWAVYFRPGA